MEKESISRLRYDSFCQARPLSEMDQRSFDLFLHLKELSAKGKDVHTEFVHVLGSDAIAYSTMTKYGQNDVISENEQEAENRAEDQSFSIRDNAILEALEMMPFASIGQIANMTFISPTTLFHRLMKLLDFVLK
jgi:hypothetical protein